MSRRFAIVIGRSEEDLVIRQGAGDSSPGQVQTVSSHRVPGENRVRLLILVPEVAFAEALSALLRAADEVAVADPVSGTDALWSRLGDDTYDVLLLESEAHAYDAADLVRAVTGQYPDLATVVLAGDESPDSAARLLAAGALSWVRKSASAQELMCVLQQAARGHASVPADLLAPVIRSLAASGAVARQSAELLAGLTARERDVLEAMVEGLSRREIAERLYVSVNTVRTHVQHVLAKLQVHTALEAVAVAIQTDAATARRRAPQSEQRPRLPHQRW
jgi:DNA-binding NarL/FixJ family response regulator